MISGKLFKSIKKRIVSTLWFSGNSQQSPLGATRGDQSNHYLSRLPIYRILTEVDLSRPDIRNSSNVASQLKAAGMVNTNLENYWKRISFIVENCLGRVLEIGCGCGNITRYISQNPRVIHVTAIDSQPEYIKQLRSYSLKKVDAVCEDILKYNIKGKFDCVVLAEIIEHLTVEQELVLVGRLHSYLNPGSSFIITTPVGFMPDPDHVRGLSRTEFLKHLEQYYGEVIKVEDNGVQQFAVAKWNDKL